MKNNHLTQPKKVAMINSFAGYGHCSTTVALPILSVMGIQVCPMPTAILSNHLAFPACYSYSFSEHMAPYARAWQDNGVTFDGLYCGYLGEAAQMENVKNFIRDFHPGLVVLDPVLGDNGRLYRATTAEHCRGMKKLLASAHVITPNLTEACILTDTPYPLLQETKQHETGASSLSIHFLQNLCEKLSALTSASIILTGVPWEKGLTNVIYEQGQMHLCPVKITGISRHGTGDAFAATLVGSLMQGHTIKEAVDTASRFVSLCIAASEAAAVPSREGLFFEACLKDLL